MTYKFSLFPYRKWYSPTAVQHQSGYEDEAQDFFEVSASVTHAIRFFIDVVRL